MLEAFSGPKRTSWGDRLSRPMRIVVGVSGSIAAYKTPMIIRLLRAAGHEVKVVATQAALQFIGAPTLAAVSGYPVSTGVFDDPAAIEHVAVGEWADLVLIAPASADLLARIAAGCADDLLTATVLTTSAPVVVAPAMHTQMWLNPATVENVDRLRRRGLVVITPDSGPLTSADHGVGRLPEPDRIVHEALATVTGQEETAARLADLPLKGRRVVVSAGGTREPIDPVRYIGNRSSGRQGVALAVAAHRLGADVTLVSANIGAEVLALLPAAVEIVPVGTSRELEDAVRSATAKADVVVMAAAVADFRPVKQADSKIKKHRLGGSDSPGGMRIELIENPDILAGLIARPPRTDGTRTFVVGFAAETGDENGDVLAHGTAKARRKGADLLAVNAVGKQLGFGDVPNALVILDSQGEEVAKASGTKDEVADALMELVAERLAAR